MIPPGFTGAPLDRCDAIRHDDAAIDAIAAEPGARLLALDDYVPVVQSGALGWAPMPPLPRAERAFLGRLDGAARFARVDPAAPPARRTAALMTLLDALPSDEGATYAVARSLLDWHARHRFCARCGAATAPIRAGWARACPACGTEHFPRTDPVVIMLAEHDGRVLVGRQAAFPPGRYSALAGFVEVGESIEEAVRRELREEAGIVAGEVRYLASQPWPFPSQLMIGCLATTRDPAITLDGAELEDARWVTREDVRAALAGEPGAPFLAPPAIAIANTLFRLWLDES